jgi:hypothetical protein
MSAKHDMGKAVADSLPPLRSHEANPAEHSTVIEALV